MCDADFNPEIFSIAIAFVFVDWLVFDATFGRAIAGAAAFVAWEWDAICFSTVLAMIWNRVLSIVIVNGYKSKRLFTKNYGIGFDTFAGLNISSTFLLRYSRSERECNLLFSVTESPREIVLTQRASCFQHRHWLMPLTLLPSNTGRILWISAFHFPLKV